MIFQYVQAYAAVRVDVGMINARGELKFWRLFSTQNSEFVVHRFKKETNLERIVCRKVDVQEIHPASIWRVSRAHDRCLPLEKIVSSRPSATI